MVPQFSLESGARSLQSSSLRCRFEPSCGAKIFSCHRQLYYLTHFKGFETQITTSTLALAYSIYNTITVLGGISRSTVRGDAPELKYHWGIPTRPGHSITVKNTWFTLRYPLDPYYALNFIKFSLQAAR